jgi:hypothetical protein
MAIPFGTVLDAKKLAGGGRPPCQPLPRATAGRRAGLAGLYLISGPMSRECRKCNRGHGSLWEASDSGSSHRTVPRTIPPFLCCKRRINPEEHEMQTSDRSATRHEMEATCLRQDPDTWGDDGEHPDDWHEDRLSLAIRVIEALGLRPVGPSGPVSPLH